MTLHMFLHEGSLSHLGRGDALEISGQEARHALGVHRLRPGQRCLISDGCGALVEAEITEDSVYGKEPILRGTAAEVTLVAAPQVPVTLVQALAKGDRDLDAIEMSTELGVLGVMPWSAERSVVQWPAGKAAKQAQKWRSQLIAAAKQSRNPLLPALLPLHSSKQLAGWVAEQAQNGVQVALLHEDAEVSLVEHIAQWERTPAGMALIVGPEGGISPHEAELLISAGAAPVGLGSLILRASSAGPVALSTVQALVAEARR